MGVNFLQDGNREICDVVISLGEVLASGLADVTMYIFYKLPSVKMKLQRDRGSNAAHMSIWDMAGVGCLSSTESNRKIM